MSWRVREDKPVEPIYLLPGDTLIVSIDGKVLHKEDIDRMQTVNRLATFDVEGEQGFESGIAVILGKIGE